MNISTSLFFDRATEHISNAQNTLARSQAQLATGKELLAPSDRPDQALAIERIRTAMLRNENLQSNLKGLQSQFSTEEISLRASSDILIRLRELGIQAANDTLSAKDRGYIAAEMQSLRDQLVSLANTRDETGRFLFSGTRSTTPAFQNPSGAALAYSGDQTQVSYGLEGQSEIKHSRSGSNVFNRVIRNSDGVGFFTAINDFITAVSDSNASNIQRGLSELTSMQDSISTALAGTGADLNAIERQLDISTETHLRLKTILSDMEDLDYAEATTRMNKEILSLEAAMSSFSKISATSLFDYIRT